MAFERATRFVFGVGVASVLAASAALIASSPANAGAPGIVGKKYSDASSALKDAGFTAKVGPVFGDAMSQDDCVVTTQRTESTPQNGSSSTAGTTVLLSLNCNSALASAVTPGNSAASPE